MDIVQTFYDKMASQYDKLFSDWQATIQEQAILLEKLFQEYGFDQNVKILDCACGIGTQAVGLASIGYSVSASDISHEELAEAQKRAEANGVQISFARADFRNLSNAYSQLFDIVICMDNALPHMLSENDLAAAVQSIVNQIKPGGLFIASIRDYDSLLLNKPTYSPPYIHKTDKGQRVSFQVWNWREDHYKFTQYIIDDEETLETHKFDCEYRAIPRESLTRLLIEKGCGEVIWKFPEETGFYQPIVIARK